MEGNEWKNAAGKKFSRRQQRLSLCICIVSLKQWYTLQRLHENVHKHMDRLTDETHISKEIINS